LKPSITLGCSGTTGSLKIIEFMLRGFQKETRLH